MRFPNFKIERTYLEKGCDIVIGCDEVGVGPIAGPVVAAACVIDPASVGRYRSKNKWYYRVRDSKTTSEKERNELLKEILENTLAYGVGVARQDEIDKLNIHNASRKAMRLAVKELLRKIKDKKNQKVAILIDGRFTIPELDPEIAQESIVGGDAVTLSISAASIIAKVHRDNIMRELDKKFPEYGFASHKGYGTKAHQNAIKKFGLSPLHRRSFCKNF